MKAQPELVAAELQPVLVLLVEPKLLTLMMLKLDIRTMLHLRPKLQQPHLLKVLLLPRKLQRPKVLHQQPRLLLQKHQPLKALLRLQKRSS